ncbi:MAG: DUF1963 domain-containing protein [Saprospiraceae bacterium]|nr:DUF1963 domain-containing protein [Saprospiraceae bacterium]
MILPDFLKPFEQALEKGKMSTLQISSTPCQLEDLKPTQSCFMGRPWMPVDAEYPKDSKGQPMLMWAQINFSEAPPLRDFPDKGILQFFLSATEWYDMKAEDCKIVYWSDPSVETPLRTDFSFLTEKLLDESPISCPHELCFDLVDDYGCPQDIRTQEILPILDSDDLTEEQEDEIYKILDGSGHKLSGYAYFTQEDPRYKDTIKDHVLLMQIDSDKKIAFGDSGVANFFIPKEALLKRDFSKAWFNWDCY